jgi:hypothetical protein
VKPNLGIIYVEKFYRILVNFIYEYKSLDIKKVQVILKQLALFIITNLGTPWVFYSSALFILDTNDSFNLSINFV